VAEARDTYALIRGGIRKRLRSLGYTAARKAVLRKRLFWYLDPDAPEKPNLDWSNATARAEHLNEIIADARAVLALPKSSAATTPTIIEAVALLEKIASDQCRRGTAAKGT
jgi:hypothetical protein